MNLSSAMGSTAPSGAAAKVGHRVPLNLMIEIFLRLPVRSLVRFRCACKVWCSITHDPNFIDAHLHLAHSRVPSVLLFYSCYDLDRFGITVIDDDSRIPKQILWAPKPQNQFFFLHTSCNGLLCVSDSNVDSIRLINPATGESLTLPEPKKAPLGFYTSVCFGYHPDTKEYKVVRFFARGQNKLQRKSCEVYTLGTPSWREISNPHRYCPEGGRPVTVKGAIYWRSSQEGLQGIVSFDLKEEKFTWISSPHRHNKLYNGEGYEYISHSSLIEIQGSVCYPISWTKQDCGFGRLDMWMMVFDAEDPSAPKYEWVRKYSVCFPKHTHSLSPLLVHDEKILVDNRYRFTDKEEPSTLRYLDTNTKDGDNSEEVFYCEGEPASPPSYHYLEGHYEIDEVFFRNSWIRYSTSFVHVESLVPLRNR